MRKRKSKRKILLFAGTTEGRQLALWLADCSWPSVVCVATGYGRNVMKEAFQKEAFQKEAGLSREDGNGLAREDEAGPASEDDRMSENDLDIRQGRLDLPAMDALLEEIHPGLVIDATHPYAAEVTDNIRKACAKREGLRLIRCLREESPWDVTGDNLPLVVHVPDVTSAADWLSRQKGNILVTTGSKELAAYCSIDDYRQRVYARVLPSAEAVEMCSSLGYEGQHIIAMQGPFSENMNLALLREYNCRFLVTKDGGREGGFEEKIKAARRAGAVSVMIDRPYLEEGVSFETVKRQVREWMNHEKG